MYVLMKGLSIKKTEVISFEKAEVVDKLGGSLRIALGRCQYGINKMTICSIKKNGYMIRRSINIDAPSSAGNSCVSDGPHP